MCTKNALQNTDIIKEYFLSSFVIIDLAQIKSATFLVSD